MPEGQSVSVSGIIDVVEVGDICAECIGLVTARVTISNLADGTYGLQVKTPDKAIINHGRGRVVPGYLRISKNV